jgi:RNA polymerase sigma factor (sigma-70 family)
VAHIAEPPSRGKAKASEISEDGDFAELYLAHYSRLVRALIIAGADSATAQDLTQEAFARTFQRWRRVRAGPNPPGYLHTIAFRLLRRRRAFTETRLDDAALPGVPGVEEAALNAETVRRVLAQMAPRQRACVALCTYLGYSNEETAELLGLSPSTVRVQVHRARQRLRVASAGTQSAGEAASPARTPAP